MTVCEHPWMTPEAAEEHMTASNTMWACPQEALLCGSPAAAAATARSVAGGPLVPWSFDIDEVQQRDGLRDVQERWGNLIRGKPIAAH